MKRKRKRKRGDKREAPLPQWAQPTGMIGSKPPREQRSYKGWGWGKLYERQWHLPNPSIKRAMLWTALFALFIVIIHILEMALR